MNWPTSVDRKTSSDPGLANQKRNNYDALDTLQMLIETLLARDLVESIICWEYCPTTNNTMEHGTWNTIRQWNAERPITNGYFDQLHFHFGFFKFGGPETF